MKIWRITAFNLFFLAGFFVTSGVSAQFAPPTVPGGTVTCVLSRPITVSSDGTIYLASGGQKRAFRTPETFFSYGYNFAEVKFADPQDLALPDGPVMPFRDGTLLKSKDSPLVYLVSDGQKRGFTSSDVFLGLGYSFASVVSADAATFADLPTGPVIDKTNIAHPAGTLVLDNGTVFEIMGNGRVGFSSELVFFNAGHNFSEVVSANAADRALAQLSAEPTSPNACVPATASAVTVASPNGGEQWLLGSTQTIRWNDASSANQTYLLYLVQQGGSSLGYIGQVVNATQFAWATGKLVDGTSVQPGGGYFVIVVKNTGTGALSDQSDHGFTITGGGEQYTPAFYVGRNKVTSFTCGQGYDTFKVDNFTGSTVWLDQTKTRPDGTTSRFETIYIVPSAPYTFICNQDEGTYVNNVYTVVGGQKGNFLGSVTATVAASTGGGSGGGGSAGGGQTPTAAPTRLITVGTSPRRVAYDPVKNQAVVTNYDDATLSFVDIPSGAVTTTSAGGADPQGIDVLGRQAVVAINNRRATGVYNFNIFNLDTRALTRQIFVSGMLPATGPEPYNVTFDPATGNVFVTDATFNVGVVQIGGPNENLNTIPALRAYSVNNAFDLAVYNSPSGDDWGLATLYVANSLALFDLKNLSYSPFATIAVRERPQGVAVNQSMGVAVVANEFDNSVSLIDLKSKTVTATIPVGRSPFYVAIDQARNRAVVTNLLDNTISVIDLNSKTVIKTILTQGSRPMGIAIDSADNLAIVANNNSANLSLITLP